ncbi:helicase [Nostocoides sp. F2B08]|uniref:Rv3654c family TadE-like protein n=1 Tax=Nostocoides sp. F2B08 TaxID=2653936 RepID=UPI001262F909|nr:Rv3654c family TadE-like protein [Tetrasphaera sp. F2B08]KAB7746523.1 helicase [Tetrasphaera sp. F2B08]
MTLLRAMSAWWALSSARRAERGSATPMILAACLVVIVLGCAGSLAVSAAVASSRAQVAADLSAVAGAGAMVAALEEGRPRVGSEGACGAAAAVAQHNGGALTGCEIDRAVNLTVEVTVIPTIGASWSPGPGRAVARARAGPQPASGAHDRHGPGAAVAGRETGAE